jgi:predicted component of type VI protein secretion system
MLTITVTSLDGRPLASEIRGKFGLLGGTIGAIEGNTIVLDDPQARIAPLEANVIAGPRGYVIRNCGEQPLLVNGKPVPNSAEAALAPGDEIAIGPFTLRALPEAPAAAAPAARATAPATAAPAATTATAGASDAAAQRALLQAFLDGLGLPKLEIAGGLSPQLMESVGAILREVTQGTIDLLRIRAETKSRMHADLTMIGSREINPLKAAWDADVALQHLLAPQRTDMLDSLRAMRDACDDLRLHDRGLVAGINAALGGLLARFDPAELEKRLESASALDSVLPGGAKAKRWDMLVELYQDIAVEAEQDFWSLFDKEFLKAYENGHKR